LIIFLRLAYQIIRLDEDCQLLLNRACSAIR
jgi:hypothetical protein